MTFVSQHGPVRLTGLRHVGSQTLHANGIISDEEFAAKKTDLLERL